MSKHPFCHRTLACEPPPSETYAAPCVGSKCAMWAPEVGKNIAAGGDPCWVPLGQPYNHAKDSADIAAGKKRLTGRGQCADNPHCEPWPDPAAGEGGG